MITATKRSSGIYELSDPRAPRFKKILAAIGWLDLHGEGTAAKHALLVAGIQEDDRFNVIEEYSGTLPEIAEHATNAKDRLLIRHIWLDNGLMVNMLELYDHDGLTKYVSHGEDREGNTIWEHPDDHWPHFRNRETKAALLGVPPDVRGNLVAGADRIERQVRSKMLLIRTSCTEITGCLAQALKDVINHPAFQALMWLTWVMDHASGTPKSGHNKTDRPAVYGNLPRR